jgi:type IV secretion system protein VirD4
MTLSIREIALFLFLLAAIGGGITHKVRSHGTLPRNRVRHLRFRLHLRRRPGRGFATGFQLWLRWGRFAAWRESGRVRPSLGAWYRLQHPQEHSVYIGRGHHGRSLRVSNQEHILIAGPPRGYKTALLSRLITSSPGAVVSTSSKPDMFMLTSGLRQLRGPVHVFNPQGIGGVPSTIRWSPVRGCEDPATAIRRADAFTSAVESGGTSDGAFWDSAASSCMRALFTAAALTGGDMRLVSRWAHGDGTQEAIDVLIAEGRREMSGALRILVGRAEKTAETIRVVLNRALSYMADPQLAAATLPGDGAGFDIDEFLLDGGTLYMIARNQGEDCSLAPVFAALANEIQYRGVQLGSVMPSGRLDPPARLVLDEVTQICPVPLPQWLADSGGQGVQICSAFHGIAQLRGRWGDNGAQSILDTTTLRMYLGGLADTDTLRQASSLCGTAPWRERGQDTWIRADVMTAAMLRELPFCFALLIRGPHAPVIAKLAKGWQDPAYKRARRGGYAVAQLAPAAVPALGPVISPRTRAGAPDLDAPDIAASVPVSARLRPVPDPDPDPLLWERDDDGARIPAGGPEVAEVLPPQRRPAYPWSTR